MYNTKTDAIFLNSRNSKTSDPHRLFLNLTEKINLKGSYNMLLYEIVAYPIMERYKKVI